jgi:hypothetical protein
MYELATIEHDLHGRAWIAMQDNFIDDERAYCEAAITVKRVAFALADARDDGAEELALRDLLALAEQLTLTLRYRKLREVYDRLAMVPAAR